MSVCPCGGLPAGASYERCCAPALRNERWPTTAEALMRSRYTAFALRDADHLFRTHHPRTRVPVTFHDDDAAWLGLRVLRTEAGGPDDESGVVEFSADYRAGDGPVQTLHEVSEFARRAGRWMYVTALPDLPQS